MNKSALEKFLHDKGFTPEVCACLIDNLIVENADKKDFNLVLKNIGSDSNITVIKDDDFPFLESSATIVASMFSGAVSGWAPAALVSLIFLLFSYRKKRIGLEGNQALLILELKKFPGLTTNQLASGLSDIGASQEIDAELEKLANFRTQKGDVVSLVWKDDDGKWWLQDI